MLAKGQAAVTEIHLNTGRATSGHWPTVTPSSCACHVRLRFMPSAGSTWNYLLKGQVLQLLFLVSAAEPFLCCHYCLFWGPVYYVRGKLNQPGLQEASWYFSCAVMVTKTLSRAAVVTVSEKLLYLLECNVKRISVFTYCMLFFKGWQQFLLKNWQQF